MIFIRKFEIIDEDVREEDSWRETSFTKIKKNKTKQKKQPQDYTGEVRSTCWEKLFGTF